MIAALALAMALLATPAVAADTAAERAGAQGAAVAAAEGELAQARAALREAARRRAAAQAALAARHAQGFAAAAALGRIGAAPPLAWRVHPGGSLAAARAAALLGDARPALAAQAAALTEALSALDALDAGIAAHGERLRAALADLRAQRDLADGDRGASPHLDAPTPSLDAALRGLAASETAGPDPARPVPWPVAGAEAAAMGASGATLRAPAWAVARAPWVATLRYAGRAGGQGLTAVLEPRAGVLVALQGLGEIWRPTGATLAAGEAFGALGGPPPADNEFLIDASSGTGTIPLGTLYVQVLRDGTPENPALWFATDRRTDG